MDNQKLHSAKLLGGIGSILLLLLPVPAAGWLLAIIGLVLVLVAVKYLADELKDHNVFTNYLLSFILVIVGAFLAAIIAVISFFSTISGTDWTAFQNLTSPQQVFNMMQTSGLMAFLGGLLIALAVLWVLLIVSAIFFRKSFNKIATDTKTHLFHTTGLMYLIGAATVIVVGIGLIIIYITFIVQIVAFFSLPETLSAQEVMPPPPMQPVMPPQ